MFRCARWLRSRRCRRWPHIYNGTPTHMNNMKQILLARENEWMSAWQRRDRPAAEAILADEFILVSSLGGEIFTKAQWLDEALGSIRCESFQFDDVRVLGYG